MRDLDEIKDSGPRMPDPKSVLLIGASGRTGGAILDLLAPRGLSITATYRTSRPGLTDEITRHGATPVQASLNDPATIQNLIASHDAAIFATPVETCTAAAGSLCPGQPAVFISSNNVSIATENTHYQLMARAEQTIRKAAPQAAILRPTLIYGGPIEQTLLAWMRAIRRYPVLLRPWTRALQQPIFYRDLAAAAVRGAVEPGWAGRTIALAGPDTLTQAELFDALFQATGTRRPVLPVPIPLARLAAQAGVRAGLLPPTLPTRLKQIHRDKTPQGPDVLITETAFADGLKDLAARL